DEVTRLAGTFWAGERTFFGLPVSESLVKRRELFPEIDALDLNVAASAIAQMRLRRVDQHTAKPLALLARIDRQHAEVTRRALGLHEHAADRLAVLLRDQKAAAGTHQGGDIFRGRPVPDLEERLDDERPVDDPCQGLRVIDCCNADIHVSIAPIRPSVISPSA